MLPKVFPDMLTIKPGMSESQICVLPPELRERSASAVATMVEAARTDWSSLLSDSGEIDLAWIDAFDRKHDQAYVTHLIETSDSTDFSNDVLVSCCEFGAAIGHVLKGLRPELIWAYDYPYWDSWLYAADKGVMIHVFSWAFKKFSAYGINDGYAAKLVAAAKFLGE